MHSMTPAAFDASDLAASFPVSSSAHPRGAMAGYLGPRFSVRDLDDEDKVLDEDRQFLPLVRAFPVVPLLGATFKFSSEADIGERLRQLLALRLPGIEWELNADWDWATAFRKHQLVHVSLAAPPDLATGQPMSLELYGRLQLVDGLHLDSEAGRAWSERRIDAYCEAQSRTPGELPPVEGSEFFMALEAATYSNVQFPGVGVPFYM
jgi:hypothetical protein